MSIKSVLYFRVHRGSQLKSQTRHHQSPQGEEKEDKIFIKRETESVQIIHTSNVCDGPCVQTTTNDSRNTTTTHHEECHQSHCNTQLVPRNRIRNENVGGEDSTTQCDPYTPIHGNNDEPQRNSVLPQHVEKRNHRHEHTHEEKTRAHHPPCTKLLLEAW